MRLAADYQQRSKKPEESQEGRKYIVRLGRGLPSEERRRRGISLSQANSQLSEQSLGRDEVSREKQLEQISQLNSNSIASQPHPHPPTLVSTAAYLSKPRRAPDNYATEHLLTLQAHPVNELQVQQPRYLSGVRSQESLLRRESQQKITLQPIRQIVRQNYIVPQRIVTIATVADPRLPSAEKRLPNLPPQLSQQSSNLQTRDSLIKPSQQLYRSNPASKAVVLSVRRIEEKPSMPLVESRKTEQLGDTMRNRQKLSSTNDPYNLASSKLTRKNGGRPQQQPQLTETRKHLRNLPECKQLSSSSSISEQSRQGVGTIRGNMRSLWDANKVQSIVSLQQSREIKVQESQIMLDYFNPSESQLRKL